MTGWLLVDFRLTDCLINWPPTSGGLYGNLLSKPPPHEVIGWLIDFWLTDWLLGLNKLAMKGDGRARTATEVHNDHCWLTDWLLVDWLTFGWLVGFWLIFGWLIACLIGHRPREVYTGICCPPHEVIGWLIDFWLTDWLLGLNKLAMKGNGLARTATEVHNDHFWLTDWLLVDWLTFGWLVGFWLIFGWLTAWLIGHRPREVYTGICCHPPHEVIGWLIDFWLTDWLLGLNKLAMKGNGLARTATEVHNDHFWLTDWLLVDWLTFGWLVGFWLIFGWLTAWLIGHRPREVYTGICCHPPHEVIGWLIDFWLTDWLLGLNKLAMKGNGLARTATEVHNDHFWLTDWLLVDWLTFGWLVGFWLIFGWLTAWLIGHRPREVYTGICCHPPHEVIGWLIDFWLTDWLLGLNKLAMKGNGLARTATEVHNDHFWLTDWLLVDWLTFGWLVGFWLIFGWLTAWLIGHRPREVYTGICCHPPHEVIGWLIDFWLTDWLLGLNKLAMKGNGLARTATEVHNDHFWLTDWLLVDWLTFGWLVGFWLIFGWLTAWLIGHRPREVYTGICCHPPHEVIGWLIDFWLTDWLLGLNKLAMKGNGLARTATEVHNDHFWLTDWLLVDWLTFGWLVGFWLIFGWLTAWLIGHRPREVYTGICCHPPHEVIGWLIDFWLTDWLLGLNKLAMKGNGLARTATEVHNDHFWLTDWLLVDWLTFGWLVGFWLIFGWLTAWLIGHRPREVYTGICCHPPHEVIGWLIDFWLTDWLLGLNKLAMKGNGLARTATEVHNDHFWLTDWLLVDWLTFGWLVGFWLIFGWLIAWLIGHRPREVYTGICCHPPHGVIGWLIDVWLTDWLLGLNKLAMKGNGLARTATEVHNDHLWLTDWLLVDWLTFGWLVGFWLIFGWLIAWLIGHLPRVVYTGICCQEPPPLWGDWLIDWLTFDRLLIDWFTFGWFLVDWLAMKGPNGLGPEPP